MISEEQIRKAYAHLRTTDSSLPDEVIDFMRDCALAKINKATDIYDCREFQISLIGIDGRERKIEQPANGSAFNIQIVTTKPK